jgi:hypothetical protein
VTARRQNGLSKGGEQRSLIMAWLLHGWLKSFCHSTSQIYLWDTNFCDGVRRRVHSHRHREINFTSDQVKTQ